MSHGVRASVSVNFASPTVYLETSLFKHFKTRIFSPLLPVWKQILQERSFVL